MSAAISLVLVVAIIVPSLGQAASAGSAVISSNGTAMASDAAGHTIRVTWTLVKLGLARPDNSGNKCAGSRPDCTNVTGSGLTVTGWTISSYQFPSDGVVCDPASFFIWNWANNSGSIWDGPYTTAGCFEAPAGDAWHWTAALTNNQVPFKFPYNTNVVGAISPFGVSGVAGVHS